MYRDGHVDIYNYKDATLINSIEVDKTTLTDISIQPLNSKFVVSSLDNFWYLYDYMTGSRLCKIKAEDKIHSI